MIRRQLNSAFRSALRRTRPDATKTETSNQGTPILPESASKETGGDTSSLQDERRGSVEGNGEAESVCEPRRSDDCNCVTSTLPERFHDAVTGDDAPRLDPAEAPQSLSLIPSSSSKRSIAGAGQRTSIAKVDMHIFIPEKPGNEWAEPRYGRVDTRADASFTYMSVIRKLPSYGVFVLPSLVMLASGLKVETIGIVLILWKIQGLPHMFTTTFHVLPDPPEDAKIPNWDFLIGVDCVDNYDVLKPNLGIYDLDAS